MQLVKQIAGKIDVPVELQQAIEAVALQLSKEVKKSPTIIEESGHYTRAEMTGSKCIQHRKEILK